MSGVEVISNANKIEKLGKEKELAPVEDGAIVEIELETLLNLYHDEIGHPNFTVTHATAKAQNMKLEGPPVPCSVCVLIKAQQKHIPKSDI